MEAYQKRQRLVYLLLGCTVFLVMAFLFINYGATLVLIISDPFRFRKFLAAYGSMSAFVFILIQIMAVILAPIPSELLLIAGGYIFGVFLGFVYSLTGILIGSFLVFFIARTFGLGLIQTIIPQKQLDRFSFLTKTRQYETGLFLLYLIPEIPKDILTYIVGLTPVEPFRFIIFSTIARLPCVIGSTYIGANLQQRNYIPVIVILVIGGILLLLAYSNRNKILAKLRPSSRGNASEKDVR
jgi:uncharacterized membrane protein YdjX (TVP38/TMEM64 family)